MFDTVNVQSSNITLAFPYHGHGVELLERRHALEKEDNDSTSFDSLNSSGKQVGCKSFEILENTHAVGVSENLLGLLVVGVTDVGDRDEQLEGILLVDLANATLDITLDLGLALLAVRAEAEILLVAPEDGGAGCDLGLRKEPVQVHDLVLALVAHQDEETSVLGLHIVLDEGVDA